MKPKQIQERNDPPVLKVKCYVKIMQFLPVNEQLGCQFLNRSFYNFVIPKAQW